MYIEFKLDNEFELPFLTGLDVLTFYEIEDVDVESDMVVLTCYALIVHAITCLIVHVRHNYFRGEIEPLSEGFHVKSSAEVEGQEQPLASRKAVSSSSDEEA